MSNPLYKYVQGKRVSVLIEKPCFFCKKLYLPNESKRKYCSKECYYKMKILRKDKVNWTEEMRKKLSKRYMGKGNPMFGKDSWNKGKKRPEIQGENHPNWKGGYSINPNGYKVYESEKYTKGNKLAEHRIVMEKYLGRKLKSEEIVHHKNHNKLDNRIENLEIVDRATHMNIHRNEIRKN